ncbi:MAG: ribosome recycling factor, partial [Bacteroidales bacterium]|nr:ribosome recycling factor [Bacteroidales bacterium]
VKKARTAGENAKVGVRNARRDAIESLKKLQKEGLPEDAEKDFEDEVQKHTDNFSKKVEEILSAKEKEIMTV